MYYRIRDNVALRSWTDIGYAIYWRGLRKPLRLSKAQTNILLRSDAEHDIETDATVMLLVLKGLIEPCQPGEHPSAWSTYRTYDNPSFPMMGLMLTGRCNLNCLHCFNAADNARVMTEWDFDELVDLLDQARDCGVSSFRVTGGEPMVHPRFLDVIREIYMRDMSVYVLNTNGWFITQELLDELRTTGFYAEVQLSFDGTGTHDWMRQCEGAGERAIRAMRLLRENGFTVSVNMQVNRKNVHTMMDSVRLLDSLGVVSTRIVRTTETPRWEQNAAGACLSVEEYYSSMLDFAAEYVRSGLYMDVDIWQYVYLLPRQQCFSLIPVKYPRGHSSDAKPCCSCTFEQVAVTSSGETVPCNQAPGAFLKRGMSLGNVRETPLRDLLSGGDYLKIAKMTVGDLRER